VFLHINLDESRSTSRTVGGSNCDPPAVHITIREADRRVFSGSSKRMIDAVLDQAWFLGIGLTLLGLLLLGWSLGRSAGLRWVGLVIALAGIGLVSWEMLTESPFEVVRKSLRQIIDAAKAGDPEPICSSIAADYRDESRDRKALCSLVRTRIGESAIEDISLAGLELSREGEQIIARFVAHVSGRQSRASGRMPGGRYPVRLRIDFRPEGEGWKVGAIRRYDIIQSAKEIPLDSLR
jgi:hypothetical protein